MNELDVLIAEAEIGEEARRFLESDIGRLIVGRAQQDIDSAVYELKNANPRDPDKITELQNQIWRGESIISWIAEAIEAGNEALKQYEESSE